MEQESTLKTKNAPPAEEKTLEKESEPYPVFDLSDIEKKIPKAFRGYIKPIMAWAESVEARLQIIQNEMPQKIADEIQNRVQQARQQQMERMQENPGQRGGALNDLMMIGQMFGMGGGGNEQLQKLAMSALTSQITMSQAITNAVVAKITGKATTEVARAVTG